MLDPSFLNAVNTNILPSADNTYDLGSATAQWANIYGVNIYEGGTLLSDKYAPINHTHDASDITSGRFTLDRMPDGTAGYVLEARGAGYNPAWVDPNGRYIPRNHADRHKPGGADPLFPANYNIELQSPYYLGWIGTYDVYKIYLKSESVIGTSCAFDAYALWVNGYTVIDAYRKLGNIAGVKQTLTPDADNTYDLGSDTLRWANIYAVNIYASTLVRVGDLVFSNSWRISEDERHGLVLISPDGRKYRFKLEEIRG